MPRILLLVICQSMKISLVLLDLQPASQGLDGTVLMWPSKMHNGTLLQQTPFPNLSPVCT